MTLILVGFLVASGAELISIFVDFRASWFKDFLPKLEEGSLKKIFHLLALLGILLSLYGGIDTYRSLMAVKDYSLDARLNNCGVTGIVGAGLTESTPLSQALGTFLTCNSTQWSVSSCNSSTTVEIQKIINNFPNSPWPDFYMAVCLQNNGNSSWMNYAQTSINILQITTILEDHNKAQDIALEALQEELRNPLSQNPSIMQQYVKDVQKYNATYLKNN